MVKEKVLEVILQRTKPFTQTSGPQKCCNFVSFLQTDRDKVGKTSAATSRLVAKNVVNTNEFMDKVTLLFSFEEGGTKPSLSAY